MRIALLLFILSAVALANPLLRKHPPACKADNCARAVNGNHRRPCEETRRADCSSFMAVTVTPSAITTTVTATPAANRAVAAARRQVTSTPGAMPVYASACSGTSRYSSACSCGGITRKTVTLATPTVTSTVSVVPANPTQTFYLQASGGGPYDQQFVQFSQSPSRDDTAYLTFIQGPPASFRRQDSTIYDTSVGNPIVGSGVTSNLLDAPDGYLSIYKPLVCSQQAPSNTLQCYESGAPTFSVFQTCTSGGNFLIISDKVEGPNFGTCTQIYLTVVPVL